jgi:hypothetical protein
MIRNLLIVMFLFFSLNSFSGEPVKSGDVISAKQILNSSFIVGDIKHSLLSEQKFQELAGDCWVKMRGQNSIALNDTSTQSIASTDYGQIMNVSSLPNTSGRFLRDIDGNAPSLAQVQSDAIRNITGSFHMGNSNSGGLNVNGSGTGVFQRVSSSGSRLTTSVSYSHNDYVTGFSFSASNQVPTANENRPINMGVNLFVKVNHECN